MPRTWARARCPPELSVVTALCPGSQRVQLTSSARRSSEWLVEVLRHTQQLLPGKIRRNGAIGESYAAENVPRWYPSASSVNNLPD